jgi:hypothetical protein
VTYEQLTDEVSNLNVMIWPWGGTEWFRSWLGDSDWLEITRRWIECSMCCQFEALHIQSLFGELAKIAKKKKLVSRLSLVKGWCMIVRLCLSYWCSLERLALSNQMQTLTSKCEVPFLHSMRLYVICLTAKDRVLESGAKLRCEWWLCLIANLCWISEHFLYSDSWNHDPMFVSCHVQ